MKHYSVAHAVWGPLLVLVAFALVAKFALPLVTGTRTSPRPPLIVSATPPPADVNSPQSVGSLGPHPALSAPAAPRPSTTPTQARTVFMPMPPGAIAAQPLKLETGSLPYESAVAHIENAPAAESVKAQALFDLLPRVPEEMLGATAERAAKLLRDRDYARVARPWVINARTHGSVLSALFADLMERPDAVALPTLVEIAKDPDHPFAPSAHDNLALLVGRDHGVDWPAWDKAVLQKLNTPAPEP